MKEAKLAMRIRIKDAVWHMQAFRLLFKIHSASPS